MSGLQSRQRAGDRVEETGLTRSILAADDREPTEEAVGVEVGLEVVGIIEACELCAHSDTENGWELATTFGV